MVKWNFLFDVEMGFAAKTNRIILGIEMISVYSGKFANKAMFGEKTPICSKCASQR